MCGSALCIGRVVEQALEVGAEACERVEAVRGSFHNLRFSLKYLAAVAFDEDAHDLAHAPSGSAQHADAVGRGLEQGDASVAQDADGAREAVKGLELEAGEVEALELRGGVHQHQFRVSGGWLQATAVLYALRSTLYALG